MNPVDCIVIGGGISGISLARHLGAAGKRPLVIEKEDRAGGRLQTRVTRDGFRVEAGAHTCYNGYTSLLAITRELGITAGIRPLARLPYLLDRQGRLAPLFPSLPLLSICLNGTKALFLSKQGKSVNDYYRRVLGARAYDRVFSRAFRAVICQEAGDYPAAMLLKKRKERDKEFPRKWTFDGGLQPLVERVIERSGIPVATSDAATAIRRDGDAGYIVETATGRAYRSRAVALAVDPATAAALLHDVAPAAAALLATVPVARVDSLSLVARREELLAPPFSGVIPLGDDYFSIVSADPVGQPLYRGFTLHAAAGRLSPGEQLSAARALAGIPPGAIVETWHARHALPSPRVEHVNLAARLLAATRRSGIYITGNYFFGLSIEDCVNRSREEATRFLDEALLS
ncbi:MAG: FAD-dependent oxidoreductase, partial [Odoribacteraceae bacterium]|nr:FAD-dependent oxidoreductase [Odoribacteraceae bacterium]